MQIKFKMCLFNKNEQRSVSKRYIIVEKVFEKFNVNYQSNYELYDQIFDYGFYYKGKTYLMDVYLSPKEEMLLVEKSKWCSSMGYHYYCVDYNNADSHLKKLLSNDTEYFSLKKQD